MENPGINPPIYYWGGGGGLISEWAYIRNNIFVGKRMGLYLEGLIPGGALKWDFTVYGEGSPIKKCFEFTELCMARWRLFQR